MQLAGGARHVVVGVFLSCGVLLSACDQAVSTAASTSVRQSALTQPTIASASQVQGIAFTDVREDAADDGTIKNVSFSIGSDSMDPDTVEVCRARHPPDAGDPESFGNGDPMYGDMYQYQLWWCGIAGDLFHLPPAGAGVYPRMEDLSVIAITVNVGTDTTAHWTTRYRAWHDEPVSAYNVDVVDHNGVTTHITKQITAPFTWGYFNSDPTARVEVGPYDSTTSTDLELSRFWPNQQVVLRFILRNTLDPGYADISWPALVSTMFPMAIFGKTDLTMASVDVDNFHVSNGCPIDPLNPIPADAQPFEDVAQARLGHGLIVMDDPFTDAMRAAYSCLNAAVSGAGSTLVLNSAWRPVSYQWHLYDVHQHYKALSENNDPACDDLRKVVKYEEEQVHTIQRSGAARGDRGQHPLGTAMDINTPANMSHQQLINLACGCGLYRPYPEDGSGRNGTIDKPHYQINQSGDPSLCK